MRNILIIALLLIPFVSVAQHPFQGDQHFEGKATGQAATTPDGFTILNQVKGLVSDSISHKMDKTSLSDSLLSHTVNISPTLRIVDSTFGVNTDTMATIPYLDSVVAASPKGISKLGQGWAMLYVNDSTNEMDSSKVPSINNFNVQLATKLNKADSGTAYLTPSGLSTAISGIPVMPDVPISSLSGTSYTAALTDKNKIIVISNGSAITVTIPPNSSVAFPIGTVLEYCQGGAGSITFSAGAGVTMGNAHSYTKTSGQYAIIALRKIASDIWVLFGDLQ